MSSAFRIPMASVAAVIAGLVLVSAASGRQSETNPQWVQKPSGADLETFYPSAARAAGMSGRATIECSVLPDGRLSDCVVVSETPEGYGFGEATVRAATKLRMRPRTVDGKPVAVARVRIPLTWAIDGGSLPPRNATLDPAIISAEPVIIYPSSAFYPDSAKRAKLEGRAVVECTVLPSHVVSACRALAEAPLDQGFGLAGVRRVEKMEIRPTRERGETAGRKVRFPIYWRLKQSRRRDGATIERDPAEGIAQPPPPGRQ